MQLVTTISGLSVIALVALATLVASSNTVEAGSIITVNTPLDVVADDGLCSLREAVTAANADTASGSTTGECVAGNGADTIMIPVGTYTLEIAGREEDGNATGDLDITAGPLTIQGEGKGVTTIDGNREVLGDTGGDNVFHVLPGQELTVIALNVTNTGPASSFGNIGSVGAFYNQGGTLTLDDVEVSDGRGAGIYNHDGSLEVSFSTLNGNNTGIHAKHNTPGFEAVTVRRSLVTGSANGLLITKQNSSLTFRVVNSTITGNTEAGIDFSTINTGTGRLWISHSTIAHNKYGIEEDTDTDGDQFIIKSSIVAYNSSLDCRFRNAPPDIVSYGSNIAEDATCSTFTEPGDRQRTDPLLGLLAHNGGGSHTHALLEGSPAIDAAADCQEVGPAGRYGPAWSRPPSGSGLRHRRR